MTTATDPPRSFRIRDVAILSAVVILGIGSVLYHWVQSHVQMYPQSDIESRARMREEFLKANETPPFRSLTIPNLSLPVTFFRSGPQDTIRSNMLGQVCSIVNVDTKHGYFVCLPERRALAEPEWTNIRFCNHLTVMGNPNAGDIERDLLALPAFVPLTELATPLAEPQADGPYAFSALQLTESEPANATSSWSGWQLRGTVTSQAAGSPQWTVFYYELVNGAGERLGFGRVVMESLPVGTPTHFATDVPSGLATRLQSSDSVRIKMVLEIATNRKLRF